MIYTAGTAEKLPFLKPGDKVKYWCDIRNNGWLTLKEQDYCPNKMNVKWWLTVEGPRIAEFQITEVKES